MNTFWKTRLTRALTLIFALVVCGSQLMAQNPFSKFYPMPFYSKDEAKLYLNWALETQNTPDNFQVWIAQGMYRSIDDSSANFTMIAQLGPNDYTQDSVATYYATLDQQLDDGDYTIYMTVTFDNGVTYETSDINWFNVGDYRPDDYIVFTTYPYEYGKIGEVYTTDIDAFLLSDSTAVIKYKIIDGPQGTTIDENTGVLSFTPDARGHYYLWVQAYLADNESIVGDLSFTVMVYQCQNLGKINGTIIDEDGNPIPYGYIYVYQQVDSLNSMAKYNEGFFSEVTDGTFSIEADGGISYLTYIDMFGNMIWYNGVQDFNLATPIAVDCGETVNITMTVPKIIQPNYFTVSGRVTDENGNGITFSEVVFEGVYQKRQVYVSESTYKTMTDSAGYYSLQVNDAYSYIAFAYYSDNANNVFGPLYYNQTYDPSNAEVLDLSGDKSGVDFRFTGLPDLPGSVAGTVKNTDGEAVPDAFVIAFRVDDKNNGDYDSRAAIANDNGEFSFDRLSAGNYVFFALPRQIEYAPGFYKENDVAVWNWEDATVVAVSDSIAQVNIVLPLMKDRKGLCMLSGNVKSTGKDINQEGAALSGASVYLTDNSKSPVKYSKSDNGGRFNMINLAAGIYSLSIDKVGFKHFTTTIELKDGEPLDNVDIHLVPENTTSVADNVYQPVNAKAYPNPADVSTCVKFKSGAGSRNISVLNLTGGEVYSTNTQTIDGDNTINIGTSNLPTGFYFVKISGGNQTIVLPLVINH